MAIDRYQDQNEQKKNNFLFYREKFKWIFK